jgi:hypothetical protein
MPSYESVVKSPATYLLAIQSASRLEYLVMDEKKKFGVDLKSWRAQSIIGNEAPQPIQDAHHRQRVELAVFPQRLACLFYVSRVPLFRQTQEDRHGLFTVADLQVTV